MKSALFKHRSIRKFRPTPIPAETLRDCLEAATRASTCGNMQLYSLVVTREAALRERLAPCHFNQPMVREAPCLVTVCADVHRFSMWCEQREAEPAYDNFAWFLNASTDALLAAQNFCIEAELHGLGICILGTTIYTAAEIAQILELPKGVIPLTTIVVGYPDESPALTDRLPLEAVVHYEKYTDYTAAEIDELWAEREESVETKRLLEENGLPNLARIFTERRYVRRDNLAISQSYFALLKEKGFFNNN
ncbi:nitroreductase family protein [uncultured Alistipes sp.]|uniref:nitroreductase family protein n=1 Tax=uncultured Alistipes sp. TaxID=538949 RepID=UPI001F91F39D|nr:nitroreductase family protein [uncultured Alistipes sp.]HJC27486.1 nitroreductase family protein [Candidatus Alistipes stercoravium]